MVEEKRSVVSRRISITKAIYIIRANINEHFPVIPDKETVKEEEEAGIKALSKLKIYCSRH